MGLKNWPIFKSGLFRKTKYLVTSEVRAHNVQIFSEQGTVGRDQFPISSGTGFMRPPGEDIQKRWSAVQALKCHIAVNGKILPEEEPVFLIGERSYMPLDPLRILDIEDTKKRSSLPQMGKERHALAQITAGTQDNNKNLAQLIIQWSFAFLFCCLVIVFFRGC